MARKLVSVELVESGLRVGARVDSRTDGRTQAQESLRSTCLVFLIKTLKNLFVYFVWFHHENRLQMDTYTKLLPNIYFLKLDHVFGVSACDRQFLSIY